MYVLCGWAYFWASLLGGADVTICGKEKTTEVVYLQVKLFIFRIKSFVGGVTVPPVEVI
jgi:hypothetical protein